MVTSEEPLLLRHRIFDQHESEVRVLLEDAIGEGAEVGVLPADSDHRVRVAPPDHVQVDVHDDLVDRDGGVIRVIFRAQQPLLLSAHRQENDRPGR